MPRLVGGPGGGSARLGYFLTEAGARLAGGARPIGAARRRGRGTFLLAHSLMGADIALAFERSACSRQGHKLLEWESCEQTAERLQGSRIVPDARLVYTTPAWRLDAYVEVDLATEGTRFYTAKLRRYVDLYRGGAWHSNLPTWPGRPPATEGTRFYTAKIGRYLDLYRSGAWRSNLPTWPTGSRTSKRIGGPGGGSDMVRTQHDAEFATLETAYFADWHLFALAIGWVVGQGYVILGFALLRARAVPTWSAAMIVTAPVVMGPLAYGTGQNGLQILGYAMVAAGCVPAARALIRRPAG